MNYMAILKGKLPLNVGSTYNRTNVACRWDKTAMRRIFDGTVPDLPPPEGWQQAARMMRGMSIDGSAIQSVTGWRSRSNEQALSDEQLLEGARSVRAAMEQLPE